MSLLWQVLNLRVTCLVYFGPGVTVWSSSHMQLLALLSCCGLCLDYVLA